jgi:hypothetical protein
VPSGSGSNPAYDAASFEDGNAVAGRLQEALTIDEVLPSQDISRKGKEVARPTNAASFSATSPGQLSASASALSSSSRSAPESFLDVRPPRSKPFSRLFSKSEKSAKAAAEPGHSGGSQAVLDKTEQKRRKKQEAKERRDRIAYHFQQQELGSPTRAGNTKPGQRQVGEQKAIFDGLTGL